MISKVYISCTNANKNEKIVLEMQYEELYIANYVNSQKKRIKFRAFFSVAIPSGNLCIIFAFAAKSRINMKTRVRRRFTEVHASCHASCHASWYSTQTERNVLTG